MAKKVNITNSIGISSENIINAAKGASLTQDLGSIFNNISLDEKNLVKSLLPVIKINDNPFQPRININSNSLEELALSIESEGLLQPIVVQKYNNDYIVIAGHRRLYAHRLLKKENIWASIVDENYSDSLENNRLLFRKAAIENIQRDQLSPLEIALSCHEAMNKKLYVSRDEIAKVINKSKSYVAKIMSIINLSPKIILDLTENKSINDIEALYELQKISSAKKQEELYFMLVNKEINREDIRKEIKKQINKSHDVVVYKKTNKVISFTIDLKNIDNQKIILLDEKIQNLIKEFNL